MFPSWRRWPALVLVLGLGCTRPSAPDPLHLGYLTPGGESGQRGLQLALREAQDAEGLIAGRRVGMLTPKLDGNGETLQAVATRLVAVNRVPALIGGTDVAQAEALGRAAQPAGACVVALCAAPAHQLSDNVFPARLAPADQGNLLACHAADEMKASRIVVLVDHTDAAGELATEFTRQFTRGDTTRRVERRTVDEKTTWDQLAAEVHTFDPQALVFMAASADFQRLRGAMRKVGVKAPLLVGSTASVPMELEIQEESEQPVFGATLWIPEGDLKHRDFAARYQQEFSEAPDRTARLTYEAGKILMAAVRRSKTPNRLRDELSKAFVIRLDAAKPDEVRTYRLPGR